MLATDASEAHTIQQQARALAASLPDMVPSEFRQFLQAIDLKVVIDGLSISASLDRAQLAQQLGLTISDAHASEGLPLPVFFFKQKTAYEMRLAIAPKGRDAPSYRDGSLVRLIVKAHQARDYLMGTDAPTPSIATMGRKHLVRMARLAYLAPDIIKAILEGRQPKSLTARSLLRITDLPLAWADQRRLLGF